MESRLSSERIFLSFSYRDRELAERLVGALRERGADVWTGLEQLQLGDALAETIEDAIRSSDVFLVLVTPSAAASAWVTREMSYAVNAQHGLGRTKVVPLRVDGAPMPEAMQDIVWLDATSSEIELAADRLLGLRPRPERQSELVVREKVSRLLDASGVEWIEEAALGGVRSDYLITTESDADGAYLFCGARHRDPEHIIKIRGERHCSENCLGHMSAAQRVCAGAVRRYGMLRSDPCCKKTREVLETYNALLGKALFDAWKDDEGSIGSRRLT